jgi:hypothetical protein
MLARNSLDEWQHTIIKPVLPYSDGFRSSCFVLGVTFAPTSLFFLVLLSSGTNWMGPMVETDQRLRPTCILREFVGGSAGRSGRLDCS